MKYSVLNWNGLKKIVILSILPIFSIGIFSSSIETEAQTTLSDNNSSDTSTLNEVTYIEIQDLTVDRSVTNLVEIKGTINNNSTSDLREVKVIAKYFDKEGSPLQKAEHFVTSSPSHVMKPDDQLSFNFLEVIGFNKVGDYEIVATGKPIG